MAVHPAGAVGVGSPSVAATVAIITSPATAPAGRLTAMVLVTLVLCVVSTKLMLLAAASGWASVQVVLVVM
ncbi:MAG: hypothetical protein LC808_29440 [Actinobacteria bacterium]|nr:hypothetical protein [Actinomycetota bacterium]